MVALYTLLLELIQALVLVLHLPTNLTPDLCDLSHNSLWPPVSDSEERVEDQ